MKNKKLKNIVYHQGRKILKFLSQKKESLSPLLILTHDFPDPDALGSAYALQQIAQNGFGIQARIAYGGEIGRMENKAMVKILKIPAHKLNPLDFKKYKHIALVDTQPSFGNNPFPKQREATMVIDQHGTLKKPFAEFSIINPDCGATSVILANALLSSNAPVTHNLATALVYGILTDTLNLYRSHQPEVIQTYLRLLPFSNLKALSQIQNPSNSRDTIATLGRGIQNAMVVRKLIVSHLGPISNPDHVSQVADFLVRYNRMEWCICTGRHKDKLYVSLRINKSTPDAGELLRSIFDNPSQAGGHDSIAGGSVKVGKNPSPEKWQEKENGLVEKFMKRIRIKGTSEFYFPFK